MTIPNWAWQAMPLQWIFWALAGHLANGAAFVIDKALLRQAFRHPATYAGLIGLLGVLAIVFLPFGVKPPTPLGWLWMLLSGATFVISLWAFFAALRAGEASRVVPIVGSLIPILTLIGTATWLGERLKPGQFLGFGLLILATVILSGGASRSRLDSRTIGLAVLSAALFALSSVTGKAAYTSDGFLTTFVVSRYAGALTAVGILMNNPGARSEIKRAIMPKPSAAVSRKARDYGALSLVVLAQSLGALGFMSVQYATSLGSAALVNALQAVQYVFLVLVSFWLLRARVPELLGEDLTSRTVMRKSMAIGITGLGMWLIV